MKGRTHERVRNKKVHAMTNETNSPAQPGKGEVAMNRFLRSFAFMVLVLFWMISPVAGQGLPSIPPEEVGFSPERLERIDALLQRSIEEGEIAGGTALIARHGKVAYFRTFGMADREAKKPIRQDTLFRIASMTKPITSVAVMMLYEEGRFLLSDPVSRFLPEFKNQNVLVADSGAGGTSAPLTTTSAKREITIRDLLVHTSGLTYHWDERLGGMYRKADITHGLIQDSSAVREKMKQLAGIPLLHHPGEAWTYGLSIDVLGALVEVVAGMPLDEFFAKRIFIPLKMEDTHFFPPDGKVGRLAAVYRPGSGGSIERIPEGPIETDMGEFVFSVDYPYKGPKRYFSGGGGLCSTISDYARFCQMLLNGGELDGVRLLGRKTVELMIADHAGALMQGTGQPNGTGFGLGFSMVRDIGAFGEAASVGTYGWGGFFNTRFWIDPTEDLIVLFMTQKYPFGTPVGDKLLVLVYQTIVD
jgi:CubicO group peptidase (beta-lactamase class C family)